VTVVKLLLETGQVVIDSKDCEDYMSFSWAVERGHADVVRLLLGTGQVEVDSKDEYGCTPLSNTITRGHVTLVKLLLETGQVDPESPAFFVRAESTTAFHGRLLQIVPLKANEIK
jgi:ankyrin repeat protein